MVFEQIYYTMLAAGAPNFVLVANWIVIIIAGMSMVLCTRYFIAKMRETRNQISKF